MKSAKNSTQPSIITIRFMFNPNSDADVIAHLAGFANKTSYIKSLIMHDINPDYPVDKLPNDCPNNTQFITLKLDSETDTDIITRLTMVPNKRDYLTTLVRADISGEITESWAQIAGKTDLNGLLVSLAMVSENLDEVSGQITDSAKRAVLDTLKAQIGDALRIINSGLDLA